MLFSRAPTRDSAMFSSRRIFGAARHTDRSTLSELTLRARNDAKVVDKLESFSGSRRVTAFEAKDKLVELGKSDTVLVSRCSYSEISRTGARS
jgi:hypothetical protein